MKHRNSNKEQKRRQTLSLSPAAPASLIRQLFPDVWFFGLITGRFVPSEYHSREDAGVLYDR